MNRNQRGPANGLDQKRNTATPSWATPTSQNDDGNDAKGGKGPTNRRATPGKKTKADYEREKKRTPLRVGKRSNNGGIEGRMSRRGSLKKRNRGQQKEDRERARMESSKVLLPDVPKISLNDIAELLDEKAGSVVKFCMVDLGMLVAANVEVDRSTACTIVEGFGKIPVSSLDGDDKYDDDDDEYDDDDDDFESSLETGYGLDFDEPDTLLPRAPVVTVMGHVDHGKTSLLDAIRQTAVTDGEAGGITQHIGAYQVNSAGNTFTFIDTPGHAAFSDMRSRGANITDIVILVVAADDSVKEQTEDSIRCARDAGVPIVVAINKCDLETADPSKVKTELTQYEILTEDLGGDVLVEEISAKTQAGIPQLLEKVRMQADLMDLKANPSRDAVGVVVEAKLEKGLGTVATVLVQKGTLKVGDAFIAGEASGKVRALLGDDGKTRFDSAAPSMPIKVVGFTGVPAAGDLFIVAEDEQLAKELADNRQRLAREASSTSYQSALMSNVADLIANGLEGRKVEKEMSVIIKADVQGSAEALARALSELTLEDDESQVVVKVLLSEVGDVTKNDVSVASVRDETSVIAFNVAANMAAMDEARTAGVDIQYFNIIYDAIESVESRMQEVLSPTPEGEYAGKAIVQEVFNIGGTGNIAGSKCLDGKIRKGGNVRVMRGDKILIESKVKTLRHLKGTVEVIDEGMECGIGLDIFEDYEVGDVIECYVEI